MLHHHPILKPEGKRLLVGFDASYKPHVALLKLLPEQPLQVVLKRVRNQLLIVIVGENLLDQSVGGRHLIDGRDISEAKVLNVVLDGSRSMVD